MTIMKKTRKVAGLMSGGSAMALAAATSLIAGAAAAQAPAQDAEQVEELVVTGSSIRGVAPVGSNLVSVGREQIENTGAQSVQQILKTVPSLSNQAALAQGQMVGSAYYSPTIHSLGSSASNSTLVLIDGHRMPLGGTSHPLSDPSIVPPIAIERVEVLADGASSVYGSDAVAGVINFITRRRFDGIQFTAQRGFGDQYDTESAGLLAGKTWDSGFAWVAYGYSYRSNLPGDARDFTYGDQRARGGTNFLSFNCQPASIQPAGSSLIYASATTAQGIANSTANQFCDSSRYSDAIPMEKRHNAMVRIEQDITDKLTASGDFVFSDRENKQRSSRGSTSTTVFATGAQANPFYINPPGVTATSQTVRYDFNELLGPGAYSYNKAQNHYGSLNLTYDFNDDWRVTLFGLTGRDTSEDVQFGQVCGSCANLALNGTTNAGGNVNTISVPGTSTIVLGLPLTPANALDVWNPIASNRTSAAIRERLTQNRSNLRYVNTIKQVRLGVDGALFTLPAGDVRVAAGVEQVEYTMASDVFRPNNTGPVQQGSVILNYFSERRVRSGYAEVHIPVISPEMGVPFARSVDVSGAIRHDKYAVFGGTTNPRVAANWEPIEGLRLRGNWSQSFVAPPMTSFGDSRGLYAGSSYTQYGGTINVPFARYPLLRQMPGCANVTGPVCQIGTSQSLGVNILSGNQGLVPQKGESWSLGGDFAPTWLPGLRTQVTWFNNKFIGGVTSPNATIAVNSGVLNNLLHLYPNGATAAELAAEVGPVPQGGNLPATVYFVYNFWQRNVVNLDISGLDINAEYRIPTDSFGTFTVGGNMSYFTKFDQNFGKGEPVFSVLNVSNYNQTFASVKAQGRFNLGWQMGPFSADLYANYVSGHRNWGPNTVIPITLSDIGLPTGGGDWIKASWTYDVHFAYQLQTRMFGESEIYLDVQNLQDQTPPFANAANGVDPYNGNILGRIVSVGLRTRW